MTTRIILLNGSPSSGKTTIAVALQRRLAEPAFYLSLDDFRRGIRQEFWAGPGVPLLFQKVMCAHLGALHAVADQGIMVIAESIILPKRAELYQPLFDDHDVLLVGVRCPLPVAQAREAARTDRREGPVDLDRPEFVLVHQLSYDIEMDTSTEPTDISVNRLLERLGPGIRTIDR